ncbi:hypothetical protein BC830DRAFT_1148398 [Chytriomyces sp. MP71]|nr:hypothetical protein BC830DRAFT_1148398 [Chytriomyces sp. MP71]
MATTITNIKPSPHCVKIRINGSTRPLPKVEKTTLKQTHDEFRPPLLLGRLVIPALFRWKQKHLPQTMADDQLDLSLDTLFGLKGSSAHPRKVAVVTGGGTGIGKMIASALAQNGARVYIASRKLKVVTEAADHINANAQTTKSGGRVVALQADLTDKAKVLAFADEIKKRESKVHVLVNNAGMSWGGDLLDFDEKNGWDRLMALNVKAPFYLTTALVAQLENGASNTDPGRVINISSIASFAPHSADPTGHATPSYNASKAALNHLTRTLACTLAERCITVNAIAPGFYPSRMTAHGIKALGEHMAVGHPMGRIGSSEDMAGLALFLVSRASAHVTGQVICSDGGFTLVSSPGSGMSKL